MKRCLKQGRASKTKQIFFRGTTLRGLTQPLNRYKYFKGTIFTLFLKRSLKTSFFRWQDSQAATAEGLTFSDPIHKKSARNLNLYNCCHSPKKTGNGITL
jgi:hypothetical protein